MNLLFLYQVVLPTSFIVILFAFLRCILVKKFYKVSNQKVFLTSAVSYTLGLLIGCYLILLNRSPIEVLLLIFVVFKIFDYLLTFKNQNFKENVFLKLLIVDVLLVFIATSLLGSYFVYLVVLAIGGKVKLAF